MSFYVTLPSNSSPNLFPNNQAGHFFVKLPQTIDVSSHYEVGLVEIQFPNSFCNVEEDDMWIQYYPPVEEGVEPKGPLHLVVPPGMYRSLDAIIIAVERQILYIETIEGKRGIITLNYNKTSKKTSIKLNEQGAEMRMSEKLKKLLGFPYSDLTYNRPQLNGESGETDMEDELTSVFVYCNLVAPRTVGDVMVPLLRTVPITEKTSLSILRIYDKPHYMPLSRFSFNTGFNR